MVSHRKKALKLVGQCFSKESDIVQGHPSGVVGLLRHHMTALELGLLGTRLKVASFYLSVRNCFTNSL